MTTPTFHLVAFMAVLLVGIDQMRAPDSGAKIAQALLLCAVGGIGIASAIWQMF